MTGGQPIRGRKEEMSCTEVGKEEFWETLKGKP